MLAAWRLAAAQLGHPAFRQVMWRAVALTVAACALLGTGLWYAFGLLPSFTNEWLELLVDVVSAIGGLALLALLFPMVASLFIGVMLDDIAAAVEARHYPHDPPGRELPLVQSGMLALRFALVVVTLNLAVLPLYLLVLWLPPANLVIYYGLNGYLLGREYFELVAWRHLPREEARALRRHHRGRLWLNGAATAFLLSIPLLNLLIPLLATAATVHIFKGLVRKS